MQYHTDSNHPNLDDSPQGSAVYWSEAYPDCIEVLSWKGYSPNDGEYNATRARFKVNIEAKTLSLIYVIVKYTYSTWDDMLTNPSRYISDNMKRIIRDFIAQQTKTNYWRIVL